MWGSTAALHWTRPPTARATLRTAHAAPETGVSPSTYEFEVQTFRLVEGSGNRQYSYIFLFRSSATHRQAPVTYIPVTETHDISIGIFVISFLSLPLP